MGFEESLPEAIREHEVFSGIDSVEGLATALHTRAIAPAPTLLDLVGDEYKESTIIKETPDVNAMVKQFIDQQTHLGNSLRLPSEHASDEDRTAFAQKVAEKVPSLMFKPDGANDEQMSAIYKSLGMPETPEEYKLGDDVKVNEEMFARIAKVAHENKFNNSQLASVVQVMIDMESELGTSEATAAAEDAAILTKDWGSAKDAKVATVIKLAEATKAPEGLIAALKEGGANSDTYKWLDGIAAALTGGEGINFTDQGDTTSASLTPMEAKHQISEIMGNAKHPYRDNTHPDHQNWIKPGGEMTKLQLMAKPKGSV